MKEITKNYQVIPVMGHKHIICQTNDRSNSTYKNGTKIPPANYLHSGKALCGILKKNQTLDVWMKNNKHK